MFKTLTISASALLAASAFAAPAAPAAAAELPAIGVAAAASPYAAVPIGGGMEQMHHKRGHRPKGHFRGRGNPHRESAYRYPEYTPRSGYGERASYDTRAWQGDDGRYYCRRSDGTTGLLIGGAAGALLGRELAGNGDRTLGTILGAAGGALLGREIEKRVVRCR